MHAGRPIASIASCVTTVGCGGRTATVRTWPRRSTDTIVLPAASATYVFESDVAIAYGSLSTIPVYCGGPKAAGHWLAQSASMVTNP